MKMYKIYHLDQLPYLHFKKIISLYEQGSKYTLSEKVDGSNCSIGIDRGKVFVKTKKGEFVFDSICFQELYDKYQEPVFLAFKRLLEFCQDNEEEIVDLFENNNIQQVFFELLPNSKPNVIYYSLIKDNGGLYLFDRIFSDINYESFTNAFISLFSKEWGVFKLKIFSNRELITQFYIDGKDFIKRYDIAMNSRKRDVLSLEKKEIAKASYLTLLSQTKKNFLEKFKTDISILGDSKIEGVIFNIEDVGFKIVDIEGFSEKRENTWKSKDKLMEIRKKFKKRCIKEVFGNGDVLYNKHKQREIYISSSTFLTGIYEDLVEEERIPKNYKDLLKSIIYDTIEEILKEYVSDKFIPQYIEFLDELYRINRVREDSTNEDIFHVLYFILGSKKIDNYK